MASKTLLVAAAFMMLAVLGASAAEDTAGYTSAALKCLVDIPISNECLGKLLAPDDSSCNCVSTLKKVDDCDQAAATKYGVANWTSDYSSVYAKCPNASGGAGAISTSVAAIFAFFSAAAAFCMML